MAKQKVVREITIEVCDFCHSECQESPDKCGICKRVGHNNHMAYGVQVYRYRDHRRLAGFGSHVCRECASTVMAPVTLDTLLDSVIGHQGGEGEATK